MAKTTPLDPNVPAGSEDPKLGDNRIRNLAAAVAELLSKDHYMGTDGGAGTGYNEDAAGEHAKVTIRNGSAPTTAAGKGFLYVASGELYYKDASGNVIQLTNGGKLYGLDLTNAQTAAGVKTFSAQASFAAGLTAALAIVSTLATGTAPFTIASTTKVSNLNVDMLDGKHGDQQFGSWASQSNNTVYQAASDGFVVAYANVFGSGTTGRMEGLTDGSNPPTTVRARANDNAGSSGEATITFPVRKGDYWKVTGADTVNWLPLGA